MRCVVALAAALWVAAPAWVAADAGDEPPALVVVDGEIRFRVIELREMPAPPAPAEHPSFGAPATFTLAARAAEAGPEIGGVCSEAGDSLGGDLTTCLVPPPFSDTDGDGEHDLTDLCPHTPAQTPVDESGCSQAQFCSAVEIRQWRDARFCRFVDWRNDETFRAPEDCRLSDTDRGFICVSRGTP